MQRLLILGALTALIACDAASTARRDRAAVTESTPWRRPGDVIDSILPMDEQFRRFRVGHESVATITDAARDREQLVAGFIRAIEQRDTAFVRRALLSRAEFGWVYYPHHVMSRPPYALSPALFWFQLQQQSEKGIGRSFQRLGGRSLRYAGLVCADTAIRPMGAGRMHADCRVVIDLPERGRDTIALFAGIFELGGRFKFVSFANDF